MQRCRQAGVRGWGRGRQAGRQQEGEGGRVQQHVQGIIGMLFGRAEPPPPSPVPAQPQPTCIQQAPTHHHTHFSSSSTMSCYCSCQPFLLFSSPRCVMCAVCVWHIIKCVYKQHKVGRQCFEEERGSEQRKMSPVGREEMCGRA